MNVKKEMIMIKLELTSKYGGKLFLVGDVWAVYQDSKKTTIQNGMNNNGGFTVEESYDEIVGMINKQMGTYPLTKPKRYIKNA
jgi:hypothetical protein